ncbi:MAG: phosphotransferase, partial [Bermanella sp.]
QGFKQSHDNSRGFYWLQRQVTSEQLQLSAADRQLMHRELAHLQGCWQRWGQDPTLAKGFIHADLFPDNSLFVDDTLSGIIDFYAGGSDYWAYDLAICLMAWCQNDKQQIDHTLKAALLQGYQAERTLSAAETTALPDFLRLAVLRFWVSRLLVQDQQQQASLTTFKDPAQMKALLLSLR